MPHTPADEQEVFTSRFNRTLALCIWLGTLTISGWLAVSVHDERLLYLVPCGFCALIAWGALWKPRVIVTRDGITVHNVTRTIHIPWAALIHIDTHYALTLYTPGRRYAVWCAPAPGRARTLRAVRSETHRAGTLNAHTPPRPGDMLSTESGQLAEIIRRRWIRLRERGELNTGLADTVAIPTRWHTKTLTVTSILLIGTVFALLAV